MESPSGEAPRAQAEQAAPVEEAAGARPGSRLLLSSFSAFQYVHVQLAGGAPWGFTLKGGLEHGEPLIVSKVEDGGKAALSQKMRSGDELVNINGTPLYGSRQEALILIKGSYRTLKMIIRRRSVPVLRPHSWHLAKLSEVRTETTNMPFPAETFSLSWHSGCDTSDLPSPWDLLSRHCSSTEKSSSLGSMESVDRSSQAYYEGSPSPLDQAMYQDKRDSAYSSFSASSNTSDSALRPEEHSPSECPQLSHLPEPRYLQTGGEGTEPSEGAILLHFLAGQATPGPQTVPSTRKSGFPHPTKAVVGPPEPPVRRDSLRACNPPSAGSEVPKPVVESLHPKGHWGSDTSLCIRRRDPEGPAGQFPPAGQPKESLPTEQYYLLSSHTDHPPPMEKELQSTEECGQQQCSSGEPGHAQEKEPPVSSQDACPPPWKACYSGPLSHRHSAPEHLLATQLKALHVAQSPEGHHWTVSPLHQEPQGPLKVGSGQNCSGQMPQPAFCPEPEEGLAFQDNSSGQAERLSGTPVVLPPATSVQPPEDPVLGLRASLSMDASADGRRLDSEGTQAAARKAGSAHQRSAQMRRRSDRFATNLRNEIQWRKAQLQKAKGSALLLDGEEPTQETEDPPKDPPPPPPPALPPVAEGRPPSSASHRPGGPRRWGSELSVFVGEEGHPCSPSRSSPVPKWKSPGHELEPPPKGPLPLGGWRGGSWRWSPEHKLQPHNRSPPRAEPEFPSDESGLLPFADRRKFFEETSKPLSSAHPSRARAEPRQARQAVEQGVFQPVCSEHRDQRRHSLDQAYRPLSSPPIYQDFHPEGPTFYNPLAQRWRLFPCSCASQDTCTYCCGERCSMAHQRTLPGAPSHCTRHCRSHPWVHCSECCYPAQRTLLEEGGPWHPRKTFPMEFPADEWESPVMNRKNSQSMSELTQCQMGYARIGSFWAHQDSAEPKRPIFCRTVSTQNLSWDCERPERRAVPSGEYGEAPLLPQQHPLRERAYSESQLCGEQRQGPPWGKPEEAQQEAQCLAKRKGPPPPRPPPPNWENYRARRASHNQLLLPKASLCPLPEDCQAHGQGSSEAPRQRSQSLPLEQLWDRSSLQPSPNCPDASPPTEQGGLHYYCHGSPPPDRSKKCGLSRPGSSPEEILSSERQWEKERPQAARSSGQVQASLKSPATPEGLPAPKGLGGESRSPGMAAPVPPSRLNSEELMRDVADRDRSLAGVLAPTLALATAAEVMGDLFSPGEGPVWKGQGCPPQAAALGLPKRTQARPVSPTSPMGLGSSSSSSSYATYYNLSAGKAELLNKMKERPELCGACSEDEDYDLAQKKVQLIESISRKLGVLQEAQRGLQEDIRANVCLGREVEDRVKAVCKPHEFEKFRLFIGDLDTVANLLLSLLGRLARVEHALSSLESDIAAEEEEEEKLALLEKKCQLMAQLEDARELQEHVARRERLVFASVSRCLSSEQLQDYQHFVRMKSALAVQQRQLDEKIKLGEEQLRCLRESLRRVPRDL